jgi:hypothetical protein
LPGIRFAIFAAHYRLPCLWSSGYFSFVTRSSEIFPNRASIRESYLFVQTGQHSASPLQRGDLPGRATRHEEAAAAFGSLRREARDDITESAGRVA